MFFHAFGDRPISLTFYRNMYHFIENRISWYEIKIVNKNVKEELKFWYNSSACRILSINSSKPHLQNLAINVCHFAFDSMSN